jgi:hypothetical protein
MEYSAMAGRHRVLSRPRGAIMRRISTLRLTACLAALLAVGLPAAQASVSTDFTALYELVPARADGFVAVDHVRLARHKSASKLRKFVHDQGGARGLQAVIKLGLVPGKEIMRSVSFNVGRSEGDVIAGVFDVEALRTRARSRLGATFQESEDSERPWFTVTKDRRFASLSEGVAVLGRAKMVARVLDRASGKGEALSTRTAFKRMVAPANKAKASLWGAGWVSRKVRDLIGGRDAELWKTINRTRFHATGDDEIQIQASAETGSGKSAKALKRVIESVVDRRFNSLTMKMLGVSALVKGATFSVQGKALVARLDLTPAQVDLVATTGGKVISILRAKRER